MSFLKDYEICSQNNEVPKTFHLFSSLVALSSLISSRVWLDLGLFIIRPNLYVVLTGDPGVKKTTAMSITKRLLRTFGDQVPLSAECQTKEALVQFMSSQARVCQVKENDVPDRFHPLDEDKKSKFMYCPTTVCVTELSQFLGASSGHMIDFLTTLYDEETYTHATKNKGTDVLPMPYLSLLACTVPDWITARLKDDVISGGFSRRCIFVYEQRALDASGKPLRVPRPEITDEMEQAWTRLVNYSKRLLNIRGPFVWGAGASEYYDNWYITLKPPSDPIMQGWWNSVHIQMLKIAMLISVSESTDLVLEIMHMEMAMELLKLIESNIPKVFQSIGRNELFGIANKVIDFLDAAPNRQMPEKVMKKLLFKEADISEIAKILAHLIEIGKIKRLVIPPTTKTPTQVILKLV